MADDKVEVDVDLIIRKAQKDLANLDKKFDRFERDVKKNIKGANSALKVFAGTLGAIGVSKAFSVLGVQAKRLFNLLIRDGVAAAQVQEEAINDVNIALERMGALTNETSAEIQAFASELQRTTGIGDEVTLELFALAAAFSETKEQAKQVTAAAIELSAVAKISLEESIRRVGRTFSGSIEDVSKFASEIKNLSKEELAAGKAAEVLLEKLGGTAAQRLRTFGGAVDGATASFGDLTEETGFLVIKNPALIKAINESQKVFAKWGDEIAENRVQIIKFVNEGLIKLLDGVLPLVEGIDLLARSFRVGFNVISIAGRLFLV